MLHLQCVFRHLEVRRAEGFVYSEHLTHAHAAHGSPLQSLTWQELDSLVDIREGMGLVPIAAVVYKWWKKTEHQNTGSTRMHLQD